MSASTNAMRPNPTEAETALEFNLPSKRDEAWKWTDVRSAVSAKARGLTRAGLPKFLLPEDLKVSEIDHDDLETDTPMAALARRFGGKVWDIAVPENYSGQTPIEIDGFETGHIRIRLTLGKGARLPLIENHSGQDGFSNIDMTIILKSGARLNRVIIHEDGDKQTRTATTHVTQWDHSVLNQHTLSFGGALSRLETRIAGMSKAIESHVHGAYLLSGKRHTDMTSYIDLSAPDALIRQSVKGVVADKARGVFQGKFHVRRPAQHTDAEMRHDALMLSDSAEIRSKPELEIYADDVACAHGNTLGALDEQALFYMRQRGIPIKQARTLLTEAFVVDVFDDMKDEALRESVRTKIRAWLEANG